MKRCPTCLEEFADKFGFCPVDGTQLNGHVAAPAAVGAMIADESATVAAAGGNGAGHADGFPGGEETVASQPAAGREEYHLTMLDDVGLTRRLAAELSGVAHDNELNWKEFKRNPAGFTQRAVVGYSRAGWNFFSQPNIALATFTGVFAIAFLASVIYIFEDPCRFARLFGAPCTSLASRNPYENLELVGMVPDTEIPKEQEKPQEEGAAGTNKGKGGGSKPKYEKPGGGGGGGRENPLPTSFGKIAPGSMNPQLITPSVRPPIPNPSLPVPATLKGDPALLPPDLRNIPFGDPKSTSTTPSDGPGKGSGQGTGEGSGQGEGQGAGLGRGRGENVGGGDPNYGGGGPGGGGDGIDYKRPFQPREVTTKAVIISKPEPGFTEEARKNNVTGLVRLRAVLSSGGSVQSISVIKGLPDGLTEKAIAAARNIKFRPAQKDGRTVSQWVTLEYNFNIY